MAAERNAFTLDKLANALAAILGPEAVRPNQPLTRHTAFRLGGPADLLAVVDSANALRQAVMLAWTHKIPCRVLGAGSNVLVSDAGVRGLVVLNRARAVAFASTSIKTESGASFSTVAQQCVKRSLAGLEWATGIPGTVGGAVIGNAGAWGGDVASTLIQATLLEPSGMVVQWPVQRFEYGYRTSILKQQITSYTWTGAQNRTRTSHIAHHPVVLESEFSLQPGEREALEMRVSEIVARRKASQPPGATCGSVFKNPPGDYAGRLVEAAGLKGTCRGDAEISPQHANFIVNRGQATAADVLALINLARQTVRLQFGVTLELEIELLGDWNTVPQVIWSGNNQQQGIVLKD